MPLKASSFATTGSEGQSAPPINGRTRPKRLYRSRGAKGFTPAGAIYVGRPTLWSNPFSARPRIGHARSVILYRAWLDGELTPHILSCAGFGDDELVSLARWRVRLLEQIAILAGRDLQCWCPPTSAWCHADTLIGRANPT